MKNRHKERDFPLLYKLFYNDIPNILHHQTTFKSHPNAIRVPTEPLGQPSGADFCRLEKLLAGGEFRVTRLGPSRGPPSRVRDSASGTGHPLHLLGWGARERNLGRPMRASEKRRHKRIQHRITGRKLGSCSFLRSWTAPAFFQRPATIANFGAPYAPELARSCNRRRAPVVP